MKRIDLNHLHLTVFERDALFNTIRDYENKAKYRDSLVAELLAHCIASKKVYDIVKHRLTGCECEPLSPLFELFDTPDMVNIVMNDLKEKAYAGWFDKDLNIYNYVLRIQASNQLEWFISNRLDVLIMQILNRI